jgi:hypothetical protein
MFLQLAFVFPGIAVGTQGSVDCVYCVGVACCIVSFSSVGDVHLFCCTIKASKKCPSTSEDDWEQHYIIPFCGKHLHSSACCSFFSMTLSMYLVSEEYPNSISHIFLGLPFIWVGTLLSPFRVLFFRALSISSCLIYTIMQSGRSFCLFSGEEITILHCVWGD